MPYFQGVTNTGGTPHGGSDSLEIKDAMGALTIAEPLSNAIQIMSDAFSIRDTESENIASQAEAIIAKITETFSNSTQTEIRDSFIRAWAATSTDNDSSKTTPANANGANNGTFATIKTSLSLGDLTNPVVLTSSGFAVPASGSFTSKKIRAYFLIGANALSVDTIKLVYNIGSGDVSIYTHGATAVDYSATGFLFDISNLTLAQLATIQLKASYTAAVVATPNTSIQLDAWAIELEGGI